MHVRSDDPNVSHIGLAGDTYTILLSGKDTNGRYFLIDMHVPPCGGPGTHRHDFEEMFTPRLLRLDQHVFGLARGGEN